MNREAFTVFAYSLGSAVPPRRPRLPQTGGSFGADFLPGGRFRYGSLSAHNMIQMATMVEDSELIGVPSWTDTASYDIDGKTVEYRPRDTRTKSAVMMALLGGAFQL